MASDPTPPDLRTAVRSGILTALKQDWELRGGRTARMLVVAGAIGVAGAMGVTLSISGHPFGHHPQWHVTVFSAVWTAMLVVALSIALLELRTPSLPLAHAASIGILGLALAGICGAFCPDPHFLHWWSRTSIGAGLTAAGGPALGALCFGITTTLVLAAGGVLLTPGRPEQPALGPLLPAASIFVMLAPGIALQSVDTSWEVFLSWLVGAGVGACLGVVSGIRVRSLLVVS